MGTFPTSDGMDSKTIQKYSKRSIPWLRKKAGFYFKKYIRQRDNEKECISCGNPYPAHAGHFYSAGHYPSLEFNENNVHAQCVRCNTFLHGNLNEYRKRLLERIGIDAVKKLDWKVSIYKRSTFKQDRFYLIEIIEKYK